MINPMEVRDEGAAGVLRRGEDRRGTRSPEDIAREFGAWQAVRGGRPRGRRAGRLRGPRGDARDDDHHDRGRPARSSDGPFMETKEQLGGFALLEVADLDEAMAWAERTPWNGDGCTTEIRPVMDYGIAQSWPGRRVLTGRAAVERAFREHFGRAVAALIRALGDWDIAEEAVQDAFATALDRWPRDGVPRDPLAWIVAVARNRAIDRLRRERALRAPAPELTSSPATTTTAETRDHQRPRRAPAPDLHLLPPGARAEAQVALTLRLLGGLTTAEVAHAFLVAEPTMAQRCPRQGEDPHRANPLPGPARRSAARAAGGRARRHLLVFNEGYAASERRRPSVRRCAEALRLAALVDRPDARRGRGARPARAAAHPSRAPRRPRRRRRRARLLETRTATRWDIAAIEQAMWLAARALRLGPPAAARSRPRSPSSTSRAARPERIASPPLRPPRRAGRRPDRRAQPRRRHRARRRPRRRPRPDRRAGRRPRRLPLLPRRPRRRAAPPGRARAGGAAYERALDLAGNAAERAFLDRLEETR